MSSSVIGPFSVARRNVRLHSDQINRATPVTSRSVVSTVTSRHRLQRRDEVRRGQDADLDAVQIGRGGDRLFAIDVAGAEAEAVAELQRQGHVVGMVGDGINDAPALAKADVGFAMNSGIDVAVETGDVVLMRHGLAPAVAALALGRATMRNIRENLFWAFAYNIIGIPFAAGLFHLFGGPVLSPMLAGAAMALSSVSVVGNALRLRFFTPPDDMRR